MPERYHIPVLGKEVVATLLINPHGTYIDGTLGGGGHAELFLKSLSNNAIYIAVDRDQEAIEYAKMKLKRFDNIIFYQSTFNDLEGALNQAGVKNIDGLFLDLGVSGHQIDDDLRGFGYRSGLKLDMRMNKNEGRTAADILNEYEEKNLINIFKNYGEERFSKNIARRVIKKRAIASITISDQLMEIIKCSVPGKFLTKSYARIFQALRIELNNELELLKETLDKAIKYLNPGGRVGVISYHSGEDRIVKMFFSDQENPCVCPVEIPYCVCGKTPLMKRLKPYLIVPSDDEVNTNPRARSAKYRVGERL